MAQQITPYTTTPSRRNPSTYSADRDTRFTEENTRIVEMNLLAVEAEGNAATAEAAAATATTQAGLATTNGQTQVSLATAQAVAAAASAASAAAAADVTKWISGTTYAEGDNVWSPTDFLTYRRKTAGGGTTDPSADSANWELLLASGGISNIVTATTATTLTSTKTLLQITPASYGVAVTLPDATTCSEGGPLHIIDNKGGFPVKVLNNSGTLLGFINGGVVSHISLIDNASAAGTWSIENIELIGASAQILTAHTAIAKVLDLGSGRELILYNNTSNANIYGIVYNKTTNASGSATLIRTASILTTQIAAILVETDKVLVMSCNYGSTGLEGVILSISGTTITVGTAATATLSGNIDNTGFPTTCGLIQVGSSFVLLYSVATPASQIRAITVSGTTVTIGAATVTSGPTCVLQVVSGSITIVFSSNAGVWYITPYTISGTTITKGTEATDTIGGAPTNATNIVDLQNGRWLYFYYSGSRLGILTLSGTTATVSLLTSGVMSADIHLVEAGKVFITDGTHCNILTDNAGVPSLGSALSNYGGAVLYVNGNTVYAQSGSTLFRVFAIDCSGASPTALNRWTYTSGIATQELKGFEAGTGDPYFLNSTTAIYGTSFTESMVPVLNSAVNRRARFYKNNLSTVFERGHAYFGATIYRGKAESERWVTDASNVLTKIECIP